MGGIGYAFKALIYLLILNLIVAFIRAANPQKMAFQLFCSLLLYTACSFSGYFNCIYEKAHPGFNLSAHRQKMVHQDKSALEKKKRLYAGILQKSEFKRVGRGMSQRDYAVISRFFKRFFDKPEYSDSLYPFFADTLRSFSRDLNLNLGNFQLEKIRSTLAIDTILYAPDTKNLLVFLGFETSCCDQKAEKRFASLVFWGERTGKSLLLYRLECYPDEYVSSQTSNFYTGFFKFYEASQVEGLPFGSKAFWKQNKWAKTFKAGNHYYPRYRLQLFDYDNFTDDLTPESQKQLKLKQYYFRVPA